MGKLEKQFFADLSTTCTVTPLKERWLINKINPDWACAQLLKDIFCALRGDIEALDAKKQRALPMDGFLPEFNAFCEFDEVQHFTHARQIALGMYPKDARIGFSRAQYLNWCESHRAKAETKGAAGFRRPTTEFPYQGGRHAQRAFFDTIKDLVPQEYGYAPTIRITEFEYLEYRTSGASSLRDLLMVNKA